MDKTVLIISTLDTKGAETAYLRDKLQGLGVEPLVMDIGMRKGDPSWADIDPQEVARAGGARIEDIHSSTDRARITQIVTTGATRLALELQADGRIHGVVALGGSTGSLMATEVMRALPFGLPKLMISSTAALPGLSTRYIGTGDIALLHSVIEISGLSPLLKNVLDRGACAMAAMVKGNITSPRTGSGRLIALTMLGPCEKCASAVRRALEEEGYQVIGFSAAGICDRAMEDMISSGFFQGVVDLAPGGVGEHLFGGMRDAGPHRLESAGKVGIPQVIAPCSVNHMTPAKSKYKLEYHQRRKYDLDKYRTWLRVSPQELRRVAEEFARKLNKSRSPVIVLVPTKGWSSVDAPGNPTYDPQEDRVFVEELKKRLEQHVQLREVEANMEEPPFAQAVIQASLELFN